MNNFNTLVQQAVLQKFGMTKEQLVGASRAQGHVRARHLAFYLERELVGRTFTAIGELYIRDHTSILAGYNHIKERIKAAADDVLLEQVRSLKVLIEECAARKQPAGELERMTCPTCGAPVIAELRRQIEELKAKMESMNARTAA